MNSLFSFARHKSSFVRHSSPPETVNAGFNLYSKPAFAQVAKSFSCARKMCIRDRFYTVRIPYYEDFERFYAEAYALITNMPEDGDPFSVAPLANSRFSVTEVFPASM